MQPDTAADEHDDNMHGLARSLPVFAYHDEENYAAATFGTEATDCFDMLSVSCMKQGFI